MDQSSPDYVSSRGRDCSLQHRFPIVDILFLSGDIREQSAKSSEISPKKAPAIVQRTGVNKSLGGSTGKGGPYAVLCTTSSLSLF